MITWKMDHRAQLSSFPHFENILPVSSYFSDYLISLQKLEIHSVKMIAKLAYFSQSGIMSDINLESLE